MYLLFYSIENKVHSWITKLRRKEDIARTLCDFINSAVENSNTKTISEINGNKMLETFAFSLSLSLLIRKSLIAYILIMFVFFRTHTHKRILCQTWNKINIESFPRKTIKYVHNISLPLNRSESFTGMPREVSHQ